MCSFSAYFAASLSCYRCLYIPSKCCFSYILYILICNVFIFIQTVLFLFNLLLFTYSCPTFFPVAPPTRPPSPTVNPPIVRTHESSVCVPLLGTHYPVSPTPLVTVSQTGWFFFIHAGSLWDSLRTTVVVGALVWIGPMQKACCSHFKGIFAK